MSLEQKIEALTAAIEANTAAVLASGGTTTTNTTSTKAADKPKATKPKADKPTKSVDEVNAALVKLKDGFGLEHSRAVLQKHGFAKMAEITPDKFDAVFADAEASFEKLTEEANGGDSDDL